MAHDLSRILKLTVPVIVQIGECELPMDEVLALGPGTILELNRPADAELDLLVNDRRIGSGAAVKVGENFGIRLISIGTRRQRVNALAGKQD